MIQVQPQLQPIPTGQASSLLGAFERMMVAVPSSHLDISLQMASTGQELRIFGSELDALITRQGRTLSAKDRRLLESLRKRIHEVPPLTIHRHHPGRRELYLSSLLDFRLDSLARLIEMGFGDALRHDCRENRCVVQ